MKIKIKLKTLFSAFSAAILSSAALLGATAHADSNYGGVPDPANDAIVDTSFENNDTSSLHSVSPLRTLNSTPSAGLLGSENQSSCAMLDLNGVCYDNFQDALSAINSFSDHENTITLHSDLTDTATSTYQFKQATTIDLNGHNLTTSRSFIIFAYDLHLTGQGDIILSNSLPFNLLGSSQASAPAAYTHFTIDEGVTLHSTYVGSSYPITIALNNYVAYKYGITVDFNGKITHADDTNCLGFFTNGNFQNGTITFNLGPSSVINGRYGVVSSGTTTVNFAGTINATAAGIEMRAGSLNVTGGQINIDTSIAYQVVPNGSGTTTYGAAIALAQHSTKLPVTANISGGTFNAPVPFSEANPQGNDAEAIAQVSAHISGGTFNSTAASAVDVDEPASFTSVRSTDLNNFIFGGFYSHAPAATYVADGFAPYSIGNRYAVFPISTTDADDTISEDTDAKSANEAVLGELSATAVSELIANYDQLTPSTDISAEDGTKLHLVDVPALQAAIARGDQISATLTASDDDISANLSDDEISTLFAAIEEGSHSVGIFDFSIALEDANGNILAYITELPKPVKLSFDASGLPELESGATRTHHVTRLHNGLAENLDTVEYDADSKTITFESDKFSSFLISYVEVIFVPDTGDDTVIVDTDTEVITEDVPFVPDTGIFGLILGQGGKSTLGNILDVVATLALVSAAFLFIRSSQRAAAAAKRARNQRRH